MKLERRQMRPCIVSTAPTRSLTVSLTCSRDDSQAKQMLVNVSVNRLNSGRVQICVMKPQSNPHPVQTYPSVEEARKVLLGFGIGEKDVDATLKLLPEVGPNETLRFSSMDVPQRNL